MSAGQIVQIMSWFKAFGEKATGQTCATAGAPGTRQQKTGARGFAYFALPMGICYRAFISADFGAWGKLLSPCDDLCSHAEL